MMAGHNIARLNQAISGMNPGAVEHAGSGWLKGNNTLDLVVTDLQTTQDNLDGAFAPSSDIRRAAAEVLTTVRKGVEADRDRMSLAHTTLAQVAAAMRSSQTEAKQMPAEAPGNPPKVEGGPFEDEADEIHALKVYASKSQVYTNQVNSYNAADGDAERQVEHLNRVYDHAADVFSGMHDDTGDGGGTGTGTGTTSTRGSTGPGGTTTRPHSYTSSTGLPTGTYVPPEGTDTGTGGTHHPTGTGNTGGPTDDGGTTGTPETPIDPHGYPTPFDPDGSFPTDDPSAGPFGSPFTTGVGAVGVGGVLGGLGLRGLISGAPSTSVTVPGQAVSRAIGATSRSGSGSVLGRSGAARGGALAPGQQTSRGAAGRGVGAAGGRGRGKKDDESDDEKDIYDVEREWTDDEGQYPGVIG
jgi:hypothetical protein